MNDRLRSGDETMELAVSHGADGGAEVTLGDRTLQLAELRREGSLLSFSCNGRRWNFSVLARSGAVSVTDGTACWDFARVEAGVEQPEESGAGELTSKMPGTVLKLLQQPGAQVDRGAVLLILEAMKMEHEVCAPADGTVRGYPFSEGDRVMPGDLLVEFEAEE